MLCALSRSHFAANETVIVTTNGTTNMRSSCVETLVIACVHVCMCFFFWYVCVIYMYACVNAFAISGWIFDSRQYCAVQFYCLASWPYLLSFVFVPSHTHLCIHISLVI